MSSPDDKSLNSPTKLGSNPKVSASSPKSPKSPSSDTSADSATNRRSHFTRQASSGTTSTASNPRLEHQMSRDGSVRKRRASYRRMSSFDFAHTNSLPTMVPDLKRLDSIDKSQVPWWTSQRFLLSIICFFGFVVLYAQRVNLSIAIVMMVDHEYLADVARNKSALEAALALNGSGGGARVSYNGNETGGNVSLWYGSTTMTSLTDDNEKCPEAESASKFRGEFLWDKKLQGLLLGAFFWGYMILQVVGGTVSERFGAKRVIAIGMFPVAILNLLSPVCARANPYLFLVVRVLVGLGEGVMYPAAQALWARWAPPNERSRLIGFSYAGGQFGNAIIFPIGGYLCAYGFDGGWPSVFYVIGTVGFIWCILWVIFASDSPEQNRFISDIEKKYIQFSIGERSHAISKRRSTPWKAIFTSRGMWAIIVAHMCGNYGAYMLLTQIPTYMKEVLKFDIKANGVFSMLPYLTFWFFITVSGMIADCLISKEILSVAWTRKLMASIGTIGPGCFLIATGFMKCTQQMEAVVMLVFAVGLCGFHFSGYFINHGDIAPAYAGTMFGISNTAATIPGILAPFVVSALTPHGTREEWQVAFYVAAAIYFFGAVFYAIFGQGEVQPWADEEPDDTMSPGEEDETAVGFGLHEIPAVTEEEEEEETREEEAEQKMLRGVNGASAGVNPV
ncbi:sialin-like isoform X2 [Littorina saxatilis]|uniref:Major facilitator superfamily (MFS) profile domain-containing protein n=1 Tax=Littorina saxatilis TaxID=31220 RepID=A0AAN9AUE9_9CAEN